MNNPKQTGRMVGALFLASMGLGLWSNFGLTGPIYAGGGFMENGAAMPLRFGLTAVTALAASAMGMAIAVLAYPLLKRATPRLALGYLMLVAAGFATSAVEQGNFLSMQALAKQYASSGGADAAMYEALRSVVAANRNGIHFIDKMMGGAILTLFCVALYRGRLVPRALAGFGVLAGSLQMAAIGQELFSRDFPVVMLAPLALTVLLLGLTLLARGLPAPPATAA